MGVKERREREKSEVRDKILDAARELFLAEGYEGVSMRKVADRIEYTPTTIYGYFADKEDLFRQLCHEDFARLAEVFQGAAMPSRRDRAHQSDRPPLHRFRPQVSQSLHADVHDAASGAGARRNRSGDQGQSGSRCLRFPEVHRSTSDRRRTLPPGIRDAELISQTLWAAVHGVIALHIAKSHDGWVDWRPMPERVGVHAGLDSARHAARGR